MGGAGGGCVWCGGPDGKVQRARKMNNLNEKKIDFFKLNRYEIIEQKCNEVQQMIVIF